MECHLRVLAVDVAISGPAEVVRPIHAAYRRFATRPSVSADALRLELASLDAEQLTVDGRSFPLVPGLDRVLQVYRHFLNALMDRIDTHAVLHAAALADGSGGALLLAAPSGHGKSSLTLELARRGLGFLSDDYAPLDLATSKILPYPRAVGVIPGGVAPIPEAFRIRAQDPSVDKLLGKSLIDIGDVLGPDALAGSASLTYVFLLGSDRDDALSSGQTIVDLACRREDADAIERQLETTPGVEILDRRDDPELRSWRLRLSHEQGPTARLSSLFDGERIVLLEKHWAARPDFSATPRATSIKRREAAEYLGREMLNRRGGGRLLARYDADLTALFLDLAVALRGARCFRLEVGDCARTADLVQEVVAAD